MRLQRLLGILYVLANVDKITVQELADRFEVSRRTIFRDLDALNCAGIPIVSYPGLGGGVSVVEGYTVDKKVLSTDDTEKLFTALNGLKSIDSDPSVTNLLAKLVPEPEAEVLSRSRYVINLSSWFGDSLTREKSIALHQAIENRCCVEMEYISKGGRCTRIVEPCKLVFKQSCWYVYGFCRQRNGYRLFRLNRIVSFKVLDEHFIMGNADGPELTKDFDGSCYSARPKKGYQEVLLECSRAGEFELTGRIDACFFESMADPQSETTRIRFYISDLDLAADFILQLADKVRVVSPPALYEKVGQRISALNSFYNR